MHGAPCRHALYLNGIDETEDALNAVEFRGVTEGIDATFAALGVINTQFETDVGTLHIMYGQQGTLVELHDALGVSAALGLLALERQHDR